jgi:Lrp/AsnC family transcriptional regulator of lysine biosynthesis
MDTKDRLILAKLEKNSRTPFLQIARDMNLSEGAVRKRVNKLLQKGIIRKFSLEVKHDTKAFIEVTASSQTPTRDIIREIKKIGVRQIFMVAGRITLICVISADSLDEVRDIVENIRDIPGVMQTETLPVLQEN